MKLIEQMNGKFGQANSELLKEFAPDNEHMEDKSPASLSELFPGLLPVWTLGTDLCSKDHPATPTFDESVENIMTNKTRATENELKLVNDKLKKVFGLEVGLPETTMVKDNRTSLWELFQKTKMAEEKTEHKSNIGKQEKKNDKSAVQLMKNMLKRRMIHSSSQRSMAASGGNIDSASAAEKRHKILRMLHRKVHPEVSDVRQKSQNQSKYMTKGNFINKEGYRNRNQMPDEDIIIFPYRAISRMNANHTKSNMSYDTYCGSDTNWRRECWIKSDAEYLVLEL